FIALDALLAVFTVTGNAIVILLIYSRRCLRINTNYFIVSLATADLLVGLSLPTFSIACSLWFPCVETAFYKFFNLFTCVSIANLVFMTIDRFLAICWPFWYFSKVTAKRIGVAIATAWLVPCVLTMVPFM
ncbi:predicted protein, partial [Nematostella vectensis]